LREPASGSVIRPALEDLRDKALLAHHVPSSFAKFHFAQGFRHSTFFL
jgi:hypothetical protein